MKALIYFKWEGAHIQAYAYPDMSNNRIKISLDCPFQLIFWHLAFPLSDKNPLLQAVTWAQER
jgi:hypothetical protein